MDFLTAALLSGLIYDGVKDGAKLGTDLLRSKLQGWLISDEDILKMSNLLTDAGITDELAPHAIEKRIEDSPALLALLKEVKSPSNAVNQTTTVGHNINNTGGGNITIGDTSHEGGKGR